MYQPTNVDRDFAKEMCRVTRDNGFWALPGTGLVYRFHHPTRTLTLQNRERLADPEALYCHMQTVEVFRTNNYDVL